MSENIYNYATSVTYLDEPFEPSWALPAVLVMALLLVLAPIAITVWTWPRRQAPHIPGARR